jgi:hypothetical protein
VKYFVVYRPLSDSDPDPDPTFHFDADPDRDPPRKFYTY